MKLSQAIRKYVELWVEAQKIERMLESKGLELEFEEVYDPQSGTVKFREIRVVMDARKAFPQLADLFTEESRGFLDDLELLADSLEGEFEDAVTRGFEEASRPYRPGEVHPSINKES